MDNNNTPPIPCLVIDKQGNFYKRIDSKFLIGHDSLERVEVLTGECVFVSKSRAYSAIAHFNQEIFEAGNNPRDLFLVIKELDQGAK